MTRKLKSFLIGLEVPKQINLRELTTPPSLCTLRCCTHTLLMMGACCQTVISTLTYYHMKYVLHGSLYDGMVMLTNDTDGISCGTQLYQALWYRHATHRWTRRTDTCLKHPKNRSCNFDTLLRIYVLSHSRRVWKIGSPAIREWLEFFQWCLPVWQINI